MERDFIALGLRWRDVGSEALTWADAIAIVYGSPPGSALYRVLSPGEAAWTHTDHLIADVFDAVRFGTWLIARSLGSKAKKPKPHPRPGDQPQRDSKHFGTTPMPIEQMNSWLGWDDRPEVKRGR